MITCFLLTACSGLPGIAGKQAHTLDDPAAFLKHVNEAVMDRQQLPSNGKAGGTMTLAALPQAVRYKLELDKQSAKSSGKRQAKVSSVRPSPVVFPQPPPLVNAQYLPANPVPVQHVAAAPVTVVNVSPVQSTLRQPVNTVQQGGRPAANTGVTNSRPAAQPPIRRYANSPAVVRPAIRTAPAHKSIQLPKVADMVAAEIKRVNPKSRATVTKVQHQPARQRQPVARRRPVQHAQRLQQALARPTKRQSVAVPVVHPAVHYAKKSTSQTRQPSRSKPAAQLVQRATRPVPTASSGLQANNYWQLIVRGYRLKPHLDKAKVQKHVDYYTQHPRSLRTMRQRAAVYLPQIMESIRIRRLPTEIALLPFVESGFSPTAQSKAGAVGLWQFIPETGRRYGLMQNDNYDGRLHPEAATKAALDYLSDLHKRFNGDWLLAFAAYNAGENRVSREIAANLRAKKPTDFWSLRLPKETREYVPRLLAFRELIRLQQF